VIACNFDELPMNRRTFIGSAAATALNARQRNNRGVSIVADGADAVAQAGPARWAAKELEQALESKGVAVFRCNSLRSAKRGDFCIVAAGRKSVPEGLALEAGSALSAYGHDGRGLMYALLELSDRVRNADDPVSTLAAVKATTERPANAVRGMMRMFTSDVEDKPWYNDREMWPAYLTTLATQRFNRFHLAFGIGYDFIRQVTDAYFLFTYPFLLAVPGYQVRVPQLPDAERDRNLAMLRFISDEAAARGIHFQLGLWMHGYEWIDSPNPNYTIEGLDKTTHGAYCRDAVRMLLRECPGIAGVTFRVHGESGVQEGSFDFWKMVFEGVRTCGRTVEIDMHPKGMTQEMLDIAAGTGLPFRVSPKFWAEHMGMTYHQADIRELERPKTGKQASALMKFSSGSRSFLRYGYGDLLREDRKWKVTHRIWPGTQRLLLWGDPRGAAAYSRAFRFCGSDGAEICEPLSFKGRRGSGIAGDRCAYADASLRTRWDWEKYLYGTRVWGRHLYNPECDSDVWRRYLRRTFGDSAEAAESALANASRILPIVTTAHGASAANNNYWPEMYLNQSMLDPISGGHPYTDTPAPKVFGNVSPFDPQLFSRMNDFADALLAGERDGKYSPIEAAQWIEDYAAAARKSLAQTKGKSAEHRRMAVDVAIQAGLGRFFGAKFRSGVLYRIYQKTNGRAALKESLAQYRKARAAWAELAEVAKGVYMSDVTVGELPQLRGHWLDRLPAMDRDIAAVEKELESAKAGAANAKVAAAIKEALGRPERVALRCEINAPSHLTMGQAIDLAITVPAHGATVRLLYRHVDQAERFEAVEMQGHERTYRAAIPAAYADSDYPLQYYFEIKEGSGKKSLYPGLGAELTQQPYFVLRRRS
jgi:hypothetical protein